MKQFAVAAIAALAILVMFARPGPNLQQKHWSQVTVDVQGHITQTVPVSQIGVSAGLLAPDLFLSVTTNQLTADNSPLAETPTYYRIKNQNGMVISTSSRNVKYLKALATSGGEWHQTDGAHRARSGPSAA